MNIQPLDKKAVPETQRGLARIAYGFTEWAEKWFPDAFVFVILTVIVVALANLATGAAPLAIAKGFGDGFWTLIPFTMQMAMVAITGYVVATSPPCSRLIDRLAAVPKSGPAPSPGWPSSRWPPPISTGPSAWWSARCWCARSPAAAT